MDTCNIVLSVLGVVVVHYKVQIKVNSTVHTTTGLAEPKILGSGSKGSPVRATRRGAKETALCSAFESRHCNVAVLYVQVSTDR